MVETTYRLVVPLPHVATYLDREGWREDAQQFPEDQTTFEQELARRGWPATDAIMRDPPLLALLVAELDFDFLGLVADPPAHADDFVLNSVDERVIDGEDVVFRGRCRPPLDRVAYQDV